jgi:hypothetical protein
MSTYRVARLAVADRPAPLFRKAFSVRSALRFLSLLCALVGTAVPSFAQSSKPTASRPAAEPFAAGFSRWDLDGDGTLTCSEWTRYAELIFRRSDKNGDGFLDAQEFRSIGQIEPILAGAELGYFDDNRDGRLTIREFAGKPNPIFVRYDRNRDCEVTREELKGLPPTNSTSPAPSDPLKPKQPPVALPK